MITLYQSEDFQNLIHLFRANSPKSFATAEEAAFRHYLKHELDLYYVLTQPSGKILAAGGINRFVDSKDSARLAWDMVHPDTQGKGFGKQLVQYRLEKLYADKMIRTVIVRTSQMAAPFYEKMGFNMLERIKDYWAEGYDMIKMELMLPSS